MNIAQRLGRKLKIASLVWGNPGGLQQAQAACIENLDYQHVFFSYDAPLLKGIDIVLVQGPYGSLWPFVRQLLEMAPDKRPILAYWFQQSLELSLPVQIKTLAVRLFSELYRKGPGTERVRRFFAPGNDFLDKKTPWFIFLKIACIDTSCRTGLSMSFRLNIFTKRCGYY